MKTIKLFTLILLSLYFTACGSQKVQTQNSASAIDDADSFQVPSDYKVADCHDLASEDIYGITTSYYNPLTQQVDLTRTNLRIFDWPAEITDSDQYKFEFYIWRENSSGQLSTRSQPVSFMLQNLKSGQYIQTQFNYLSTTAVKKIIADNGLNQTVEAFLKDHKIILLGLEDDQMLYHAATMGIYSNSGSSSSAVKSVSFLLPHIPAHPKIYRAQHINDSLIKLHPHYDQMNAGLTDQQYFDQTEQYCSQFMAN